MSRIKLPEFTHYPFNTVMEVRVGDLNYGNHLGNDRVLAFAHEARVRFLQALGYQELDLGGPGIILSDAAVAFRAEGKLGDLLKIEVVANNFSRVGFDLHYRMSQHDSGQVVALVKTGVVCFDYQQRKVTALPASVKSALESPKTTL